jgi:hypothetical protein
MTTMNDTTRRAASERALHELAEPLQRDLLDVLRNWEVGVEAKPSAIRRLVRYALLDLFLDVTTDDIERDGDGVRAESLGMLRDATLCIYTHGQQPH